MNKRRTASVVAGVLFSVVLVSGTENALLYGCMITDDGTGCVFAELGGVQLVSIPVATSWSDILATRIEARTVDPAATMVTFTELEISGDVQHVWAGDGFQPPGGNAKGPPVPGVLYDASWVPLDSHLLITDEMVGGGAGGGYFRITDTNDGSTTDLFPDLPSVLNGTVPAQVGFGPIRMADPTDAFFVEIEFQKNSIELAYLVTPAEATAGADGGVTMRIGILGTGIVDAGSPGGAAFGYDGNPPVVVPFVPEPATSLMVPFACLGLAGLRRRRKDVC